MVSYLQIEKIYYAVVANHVQSKFQVVCAPLRPDPTRPLHQVLIQHCNQLLHLLFLTNAILLIPSTQIVDHAKGKDAQTHVERVDHTDDLADNSISDVRVLSYVKLMPLTGR